MAYKVGICGHFGEGKNLVNGQTIKTKNFSNELEKIIGTECVERLDTHGWKKDPFKLLFNIFKLLKNNKDIILFPAHNGVKVFIPIVTTANIIFKRQIHYIVIGGWLPNLLAKNKFILYFTKKLNSIHVETNIMKNKLQDLGLNNVYYLPNFKRLTILKEEEINKSFSEPYKLCTFSRVMKEKGIEDAIEAVIAINKLVGKEVFNLDIYGQVDDGYIEKFEIIRSKFPTSICYKGIIESEKSVQTIKEYFVLLFPTYYSGEGFAGTLLDALSAGVPVIASDWKYNSEIIEENIEGYIFATNNIEDFTRVLKDIYLNPRKITSIKINCIKKAKQYEPDLIISNFIKHLD